MIATAEKTKTKPAADPAADAGAALDLFAAALKSRMSVDPAPALDRAAVETIIKEYMGGAVHRIEVTTPRGVETIDGAHTALADVLARINAGCKNVFLSGPAGTGKTTLARSVAAALSLDFAHISLSAGASESHLLGRILPVDGGAWKYQKSAFVRVYENGGVFLLDEIDAADPNLMLCINSALANGHFANPLTGQTVQRHPDAIVIAAANTYGRGADALYVGRNQLDATTLDRFVLAIVRVDYDTTLERGIMSAAGLVDEIAHCLETAVQNIRAKIDANRLRRVCSTRFVDRAAAAMASGESLESVLARYFADWSADEIGKIKGGGK